MEGSKCCLMNDTATCTLQDPYKEPAGLWPLSYSNHSLLHSESLCKFPTNTTKLFSLCVCTRFLLLRPFPSGPTKEERPQPLCLSLLGLLWQNPIDSGAYKQQKLCPHSFGGWEVQNQGTSRFSVWRNPASLFTQGAFSLCPHLVEGAKESVVFLL